MTLDTHDRKMRKLGSESLWMRETLGRIAESVASVSERMTVMSQRFGEIEKSIRSISRTCRAFRCGVDVGDENGNGDKGSHT